MTITDSIAHHGYLATFVLMFLESCNIPVPSEPVLMFSGFLVVTKDMSFWGMVLASTIGCVLGSLPPYALGRWGGRPLVYKYRRLLLLTKKDLDRSDRWFDNHRTPVLLISRMLPLVRAVISIPAGIYETPIWIFCLLTALGSLVWSVALVYLGMIAGTHWEQWAEKFNYLLYTIISLAIMAVLWYIWHKIHKIRTEDNEEISS